MNKFHQIPTNEFVPISHDNSFLFNHYDKIANFLAINFGKDYKNILAKPVQNGYTFEWFSIYSNLTRLNEQDKATNEAALLKYFEFIEVIEAKVAQLANSKDTDSKNWAALLSKVFNRRDNFIFSNGQDICIIWGWKFDSNEIYKPTILKNQATDFSLAAPVILSSTTGDEASNANEPQPDLEELPEETRIEDEAVPEDEKEELVETPHEEPGFWNFLRWFASRFWWLLWMLLLLILLLLLFKSCDCNRNDEEINRKLNELEQRANDCCN